MKRAKRLLPSPIVLASRSPRRREILDMLGIDYRTVDVDVDERPLKGESSTRLARRLALTKALAALETHPTAVILAADTIVSCGRETLGKPRDLADARRMLELLSGRSHHVVTAIAWLEPNLRPKVAHTRTRVRFSELTADEIERYLQSDEPWDKAGAYALQGAASWFVAEVHGSVSNVIGLPIETLRTIWLQRGTPAPRLGVRRRP